MKGIFIPFTCAVALATMAGAGVQHWLLVRDQVESPPPALAALPPLPTPAESPTPTPSAQPATVDPELVARLERVIAGQEKIMERFAQLDRQNIELRDQVAETNRDVMDLQFRVDSHSESFRPLRAIQANTLAPSSSVLPPRE